MKEKQMTQQKRPSRFGEINKSAKQVGRIVAFLSREQLDFLDKIGKDAMFSTGKKLSRTEIVQAMVETMRKLDISGSDIRSADELERRMLDVAKKALSDAAEQLKKEATYE